MAGYLVDYIISYYLESREGKWRKGQDINPRALRPINKKQQKLRFCTSLKVNKNMRASSQFLYLFGLPERLRLSATSLLGGKDRIRTCEGREPLHAFQACALNHSATFPRC